MPSDKATVVWELDSSMKVASRDLEEFVREAGNAGIADVHLHSIVPELERLIGKVGEVRPKSPADAVTSKRTQLPKMRILPPRRDVLERAHDKGSPVAPTIEAEVYAEEILAAQSIPARKHIDQVR